MKRTMLVSIACVCLAMAAAIAGSGPSASDKTKHTEKGNLQTVPLPDTTRTLRTPLGSPVAIAFVTAGKVKETVLRGVYMDVNTGKTTLKTDTRLHKAEPNERLLWVVLERVDAAAKAKADMRDFTLRHGGRSSECLASSGDPLKVYSGNHPNKITFVKGTKKCYLLFRVPSSARSIHVKYKGKGIEVLLPSSRTDSRSESDVQR